jgi:hypothetical protein
MGSSNVNLAEKAISTTRYQIGETTYDPFEHQRLLGCMWPTSEAPAKTRFVDLSATTIRIVFDELKGQLKQKGVSSKDFYQAALYEAGLSGDQGRGWKSQWPDDQEIYAQVLKEKTDENGMHALQSFEQETHNRFVYVMAMVYDAATKWDEMRYDGSFHGNKNEPIYRENRAYLLSVVTAAQPYFEYVKKYAEAEAKARDNDATPPKNCSEITAAEKWDIHRVKNLAGDFAEACKLFQADPDGTFGLNKLYGGTGPCLPDLYQSDALQISTLPIGI